MSTPNVIHDSPGYLVLNKPGGWIVTNASTSKAPSIQDWLADNFKYKIARSREQRGGIVHRLDKETSGILLVAKDEVTLTYLQSQFKSRLVKKRYVALLHGALKNKEGKIDAPVGRLPWNRERFGVFSEGRDARTKYKLKEIYKKENKLYSLVYFFPETGRTHQIRVHAKEIGHPVVADTFYAGRKTARTDRKWCPRLFLHANRIIFEELETGKRVSFESKLPEDLAQALSSLHSV